MTKNNWNLLIDFDGTLHDTETIFAEKLNGIFGLDGQTMYNIYLFEIHRKLVHEFFPKKHDERDFHHELLCDFLKKPKDEKKTEDIEEADVEIIDDKDKK